MRTRSIDGNSSHIGAMGNVDAETFVEPRTYVDDGTIEIDNNAAERALRVVALGRTNFPLAGSDVGGERAAVIYSLLGSARLNGLDPELYFQHASNVSPTIRSTVSTRALVQMAGDRGVGLGDALELSGENGLPDRRCSLVFEVQPADRELSFADAVKQLDAGDRGGCVSKGLEPEHGTGPRLDAAVILFYEVVQVLR